LRVSLSNSSRSWSPTASAAAATTRSAGNFTVKQAQQQQQFQQQDFESQQQHGQQLSKGAGNASQRLSEHDSSSRSVHHGEQEEANALVKVSVVVCNSSS
jgi:hypothetical protein